MFGLESDKERKKSQGGVTFDLEKDLQDPKKAKAIQQNIEIQTRKVKEMLRAGSSQEELERLNSLLLGYNAALKVAARYIGKAK